ncbi:hypothetical protein BS47DRAFT_338271 [Hydnum rufescens UP504]|uniref:Transmembrane protein n=1 Tax=Hydnum rufescens UP504 TaxID=1448309 RepID=A0A9P6AJX6_9AGAM|nr:hypothetical protein BS47DRAFT_338271 [Hydnum rufescens UP504]
MAEGAISLPLYPPNADEPKDPEYDDDIAIEEGERLLSATQNHAFPSSRKTKPASSSRSRRTIVTSASRRARILGGLFFVFSVFVFLVIPAFLPQTSHHYTGMPVAMTYDYPMVLTSFGELC